MLRNDPRITGLMYVNAEETLSKLKGITIAESKKELSNMSFSQYVNLLEAGANITPPSGQAVGPSAGAPSMQPSSQQSQQQKPQAAPQKAQVIWPGKGSPVEQGMTVGLKGPNGLSVPGEITQVDQSANGVKVRNPTTGQEEWHGNDDLQPYMAQQQSGSQQQMAEELSRLKQLAGIAEDSSGGASCAGAMGASTPQPLGKKVQRRQMEETPAVEYKQGPQKTVVGDTKPNQASGKLSADLAARGKKTASRINNGIKR